MPGRVWLGAPVGMALGLWYDASAGALAALGALCVAGPRDLAGMLALHWALLPGMHLGMLAGMLVPCWLAHRLSWPTLASGLFALAWMLVGMAAGSLAFAALAGSAASPAGMVAAMLGGMAWGMAAGTASGRLAAAWAASPTLGTRR